MKTTATFTNNATNRTVELNGDEINTLMVVLDNFKVLDETLGKKYGY